MTSGCDCILDDTETEGGCCCLEDDDDDVVVIVASFDCIALLAEDFFVSDPTVNFVDTGIVDTSVRIRFGSGADIWLLAVFSVKVSVTVVFAGCEAAGCVVDRRRFDSEGDRLRDRDWV